MTSYASFLPGQGPGLAGLQQQPAGVQDQIQQLQNAQAPANYRSLPQVNQFEGLQRAEPQRQPLYQGQAQQAQNAQQPSQQQMQQMQAFQQQMQEQIARQEQTPQQQQMQGMQTSQQALPGTTGSLQELMLRRRPTAPVPRPPKAEGLGVSNFVGASSNDMQRMLSRGSISGDNMGDAQRQMEQTRTNEFLNKMRAQNPERFNNAPPPPLAGGSPQFPGSVPPGIQQYPIGAQIQASRRTAPPAGGIMGQAPPEMAQNIPLMQNQMAPVPGYGLPPVPQTSAGMGFSPPPMNPMQGGYGSAGMMGMAPPGMAQMAAFPQQTMQQGGYAPTQQVRGSQNSPPIQSPFV